MYDFKSVPSMDVLTNPKFNPFAKESSKILPLKVSATEITPELEIPPTLRSRLQSSRLWKIFRWIWDKLCFWNVRKVNDRKSFLRAKEKQELLRLRKIVNIEKERAENYRSKFQILESQVDSWIELNAEVLDENAELRDKVQHLENELNKKEQLLQCRMLEYEASLSHLRQENSNLRQDLETKGNLINELENPRNKIPRQIDVPIEQNKGDVSEPQPITDSESSEELKDVIIHTDNDSSGLPRQRHVTILNN